MKQPSFTQKPENEASPVSFHQQDTSIETIELEERFKQLQDDLHFMFTVRVTSQASLQYPWVKDELYSKVVEGLKYNEYFALDFMVNEENPVVKDGAVYESLPLLSHDDLVERGIRNLQDHGKAILRMYKEPRLRKIKELFIRAGMFTEKEIKELDEEMDHSATLH